VKKNICLVVVAVMLFQCSAYARNLGWNIDKTLKFQLVYLADNERAILPANQMPEPLLKNIPAFKPDIDNIVYKNILELGFPLPARDNPAALKLYLKLYAWPEHLNSSRSSNRIFDAFMLNEVRGGSRLYKSSQNPANVYLKYALIESANNVYSENKPFCAPKMPVQCEFDASLPFSSIYVTPSNLSHRGAEADKALASAQGVVAFYAALSKVYERSLYLLAMTGEKKYFADFRRCSDNSDKICAVRIYEMPLKPMLFTNYRDLPMPQDVTKVFLSGLLLVKLTDYDAYSPISMELVKNMRPGTDLFDSNFHSVWSHMLEVGSVLDLR